MTNRGKYWSSYLSWVLSLLFWVVAIYFLFALLGECWSRAFGCLPRNIVDLAMM